MDERRNDDQREDYPLSEIPAGARRGFWSNAVVLLGFTFFTATMWGGGSLGTGLKFWPDLLMLIVAGNLLLGAYVAALGFIAYKSGLNTVLMCRFCFGDKGSRLTDLLLGFTQVGWYAWGTATIAIMFVKLLHLPGIWTYPLMVIFGMAFCWTAYYGYRGLEMLSRVAVPMMTLLILWSMTRATRDAGGLQALLEIIPEKPLSAAAAITIVFGTFVSGGTQSPNWSRFSNSAATAVGASLLAFFIGNGLMIFCGAYGALVYKQADIVEVLSMQGLLGWGILMLLLNIWTTQDNTVYNFSVAGCNLFRSRRRRVFTVGGAALGTVLAMAGMYNWLVPWLLLLGTFFPPIGGIIMADCWLVRRGRYPSLDQAAARSYNMAGLLAYVTASAGAWFTGRAQIGIPPINGILLALIIYPLLFRLLEKRAA
ncbi:MAG TPA: cytosine permease [Kiritimatiellia bacterium]|nr:cytosine permease [Kiritimatiellia bacterium]